MFQVSLQDFLADSQGARFQDVLNDNRLDFSLVLEFFNQPPRQKRMEESEIHHDRPALAGVIKEFEEIPEIDDFLSGNDAHTTTRFRQAVGVLVRIIMEGLGWQRAGRKGSLGTRAKVSRPTSRPGAYWNKSGISIWFTSTERYLPPESHEFFGIWQVTQDRTVGEAYLIKSIPANETPEWLAQLNTDKGFFIPLSVRPRRNFEGVVLIHGERALVFDECKLREGTDIDVSVGSEGSQAVRDKVQLHVDDLREGRSLIRGFQGIRYMRLVDVVDLSD